MFSSSLYGFSEQLVPFHGNPPGARHLSSPREHLENTLIYFYPDGGRHAAGVCMALVQRAPAGAGGWPTEQLAAVQCWTVRAELEPVLLGTPYLLRAAADGCQGGGPAGVALALDASRELQNEAVLLATALVRATGFLFANLNI